MILNKKERSDNMKEYIIYKCKTCECEFILPKKHVRTNVDKGNDIRCPYRNHKNIIVTGAHDSIKDCMSNNVYVREKGRMKQIK